MKVKPNIKNNPRLSMDILYGEIFKYKEFGSSTFPLCTLYVSEKTYFYTIELIELLARIGIVYLIKSKTLVDWEWMAISENNIYASLGDESNLGEENKLINY